MKFLTGESFLIIDRTVVDMDELAADSLGLPHPCLAGLVGVWTQKNKLYIKNIRQHIRNTHIILTILTSYVVAVFCPLSELTYALINLTRIKGHPVHLLTNLAYRWGPSWRGVCLCPRHSSSAWCRWRVDCLNNHHLYWLSKHFS